MRQGLLAVWALLSVGGWASDGSVGITGRGTVERAPEYAELQVKVVSLCYEKPVEAQQDNALLARNLQEVLKPYVRTEKDELVITGGHTLRQSEYGADENGRSHLICDRKWRTMNTLILKTNDMEAVSVIQQQILDVLKESDMESMGTPQATYAELLEPSFSVYPETFRTMKKEAQVLAWGDALEQFQVFYQQCKLNNVKLSEISQPEYFGLAKSAPVASDYLTPIIPDAVAVTAVWKFVWSFDPTPCFR